MSAAPEAASNLPKRWIFLQARGDEVFHAFAKMMRVLVQRRWWFRHGITQDLVCLILRAGGCAYCEFCTDQ